MNHYCTNCGVETTTLICQNCGVKNNKVRKYCYWCGSSIDENASICLNCRERVNVVKPFKIKIVRILLVLWSAFCAVGFLSDGCVPAFVVLLLATVLAVPLWRTPLAHITHRTKHRNFLRIVLKLLGILLFIFLYLLGWEIGMANEQENEAMQPQATIVESEYTQEEQELYDFVLLGYSEIYNSLKNPDSLRVYGIKQYDSETIVFRITATNGFGGTITEYFAYNGALLSDAQVLYKGESIDWNEVVKYSQSYREDSK